MAETKKKVEEVKEETPKKTSLKKTTTTTTKKAAAPKATEKVVKEEAKEVKETKPAKKVSQHKVKENVNRVEKRYLDEIVPELMKRFEYKNVHEVPALKKIVVNIGVGDTTQDKKRIDEAFEELGLITGQKPIITKAKKSIATFKLREGEPIGVKVTLRGKRMYEFFDKLVTISLPRVRDFRGVSKNSFDGRGNYTLGVKEQLIFPEIDYDKVQKVRGMDVVIVTSSKTDEEAYALLKELGMPFTR